MGHLVRHRSPAGEERYEDVTDLDAAVERAEHLRNVEGVSDVRVYREVPLEFRTYVRVAVADDQAASGSRPSGSSVPSGSAARPSGAAPSGAAVISPPPASTTTPEGESEERETETSASDADAEAPFADNRRISLFNRGQAS